MKLTILPSKLACSPKFSYNTMLPDIHTQGLLIIIHLFIGKKKLTEPLLEAVAAVEYTFLPQWPLITFSFTIQITAKF